MVLPGRMSDMHPENPQTTSLVPIKAQERRLSVCLQVLGFLSLLNILVIILAWVRLVFSPSIISVGVALLSIATLWGMGVVQRGVRAAKQKLVGDRYRSLEVGEAAAQRELMVCAPDLADSLRSHRRGD